jgi:GNAT superfamily N-acetyltransferase
MVPAVARDYAAFMAEEGRVIAGMIGLLIAPSFYRDGLSGAIIALVVASEFGGRGIAELLVNRGEQWFREAGADRVTVNPSTHRAPAHRLYTRLGYAPTGIRFTKAL